MTCSAGIFGRCRRPGGPQQQPRRGADVESEVTLSFTDAVDGATVPLRMSSERALPGVPGHRRPQRRAAARPAPPARAPGRPAAATPAASRSPSPAATAGARASSSTDPCPELLRQRPRRSAAARSSVRIPAGVQDGQRIRLKGKGGGRASAAAQPATSTSPCTCTPHRLFGRTGDNLTVTVPVTFAEAALGANVSVPTLDGGAGDAEAAGRHGQRAHLPGPRARVRPARTAPAATCWSPSR